jgi:Asp-tRNA(Asn)/Glu-tRNA(Gln) amidotransferase A subunit family amidase
LALALGFPAALPSLYKQEPAELACIIGCVAGELLADCEAPVLQSLAEWKDHLARSGATLHQVDGSSWMGAYDIFAPIQAHEASQLHRGLYDNFEPAIADRLRWGASLSPKDVQRWRLKHQDFLVTTTVLFAGCDFLLLPATPVAKLDALADHSAARPRILRCTTPASLAGLPVVVLPGRAGGVQLIGRHGEDARLLAYAAHLGQLLALESARAG